MAWDCLSDREAAFIADLLREAGQELHDLRYKIDDSAHREPALRQLAEELRSIEDKVGAARVKFCGR